MLSQIKYIAILIFVYGFIFLACGSGNTGNNQIDTDKTVIIKSEALINKTLFAEANSGFEYTQITDCALLRLNDNLLSGSIPAGKPQVFTLDRSRKSIFYSNDTKTIKEFSIQTQTIDPIAMAVSKDGFVFILDKGSMSIVKFIFNGLTLNYVTTIYVNVTATDIAIDENSYIYIADESQNRILKIDSTGNPINSFSYSGTNLNILNTYKNLDGNNMPLTGLRGIYVDLSGYIYAICGYGLKLIVFKPDGKTETTFYISPKIAAVDVAATNKFIYLVSKTSNAILLINKMNIDIQDKLEMPEHSYPWGKVENISKIAIYAPYNVIAISGKDGAEIFTEMFQ